MTRGRWTILAVVSAATAMLLLDVSVVNVALPAIRQDLGASFGELQWVIDAYALTMAATLLGAGALGDRVGRRSVFVGGLLVFTAGSAWCAVAGSGTVLDVARAAQGVGAAAMFACSLALLAHEFQGAERGFALGVWGAVTGAAIALGPLVGGLLVDAASWRWIFLVNLPLGLLLVVLTLRVVPESRDERSRPLDLVGMTTFGLACFLATYALIRGNEDGWGSAPILAALMGASVALLLFVAVERRAPAPMLPLSLFRVRAFTGTALVAFAQSVALYPMFLFMAIYFQEALGVSPTGTGLRLLPMTLVLFAVAPVAGRLTSRVALRVPLTLGLALIGGALLLMRSGLTADGDWTDLLPGFLLGGVAIGIISPSLAAAMVSVLPVERSGLASGVNNTFRQLGIAIGVAGLGAIFTHRIEHAAATQAGIVDGLHAVLLVAAVVALVAAVLAWPLLGGQRSGAGPSA